MPKIIARYQGEDKPPRSDRAPQRTADLRFPNSGIITHWHFNDAESRERTFENYFNRPAVRVLLELKPAKHICSPGAEGPEITDPQTVKKPNQAGREAISQRLMPWQRPGNTLLAEARTQRDIRTALNDRSQQKWQL